MYYTKMFHSIDVSALLSSYLTLFFSRFLNLRIIHIYIGFNQILFSCSIYLEMQLINKLLDVDFTL